MTIYTERLIIIIQAADRDTANALALESDPGAGTTFRVGLSATGNAPTTHYWCNWAMPLDVRQSLIARMNSLINTGRIKVYDAATTTIAQALADAELQPIKGPLG